MFIFKASYQGSSFIRHTCIVEVRLYFSRDELVTTKQMCLKCTINAIRLNFLSCGQWSPSCTPRSQTKKCHEYKTKRFTVRESP